MKNETTINELKKIVIYCRVSTKEQVDEGNSLVSQERICREYAISERFQISEVFIEKGESAKTTERKELQRMLAFCADKKNNIYAVIAYKVDRISRNIADYSNIKVRLKRNNILIKSVSENFEDTPAGRFMENIIANVSQFDNEVRTERSVGGMKEAVLEGRYVWRAPLGYKNIRIGAKSTIEPDEFAPLVAEVFELISQKRYPTEIIRLMMKEKGLVDKNGNAIGRSYFFRIIRNPLYKGIIKQFGTVIKASYEPLVSEALFDDVQAILKGRKNKIKHYLKEHPDFPLRRFVLNENGKQLTGYWSKGKRLKYPYYSFQQPGTTIRKEVLEQKYIDFLQQYTFDTTHLDLLKDYLEYHFEKKNANEELANAATENRIMEINKEIDNLFDIHRKGNISDNLFATRIKRFEMEQEELEKLLKPKLLNVENIKGLLNYVAKALQNPGLFWKNCSVEIKRKLQVFDFPNGVVFDGVNFRTLKVSSIYNVKVLFDSLKFPIVNLRDTGKNTQYSRVLPPSSKILLDSKAFWENVHGELQELYAIVGQLTVNQNHIE